MTTRFLLLRFQQEIFSNLRSEVRENLGPLPRSLRRYYKEYRQEFSGFHSFSSLPDLLDKIRACHITYCGDYHTLPQAQQTHLSLLQQIVKKRKVVLAVELVYSNQQPVLDRYVRNEIDDETFLKSINYNMTFGFDWRNYKPIFDLARSNGLQMMAIDRKPASNRTGLYERDRWAAKLICDAALANPDALIWVMVGDLHLAERHLPGIVQEELSSRGEKRNILVIHQNNEKLFWEAARRGLSDEMEIIKIKEQVYCILNTPPWIKLYSYFSWLQNSTEKTPEDLVFADEFYRFVGSLARFLGLEDPEMADFVVYVGRDNSFLSEFEENSKAYQYYKKKWAGKEHFLVPDRRIIYMAYPDVDDAAEVASRYIHCLTSGFRMRKRHVRSEFFRRVCHYALGFLGSKLLNHHRPIEANTEGANAELATRIARHPASQIANALKVGRLMGERIYVEMLNENVRLEELHDWFCNPFLRPHSAENLYRRFSPF